MTPALHLLRLRDAGAVDQQLAGPVLRELRMRKDDAELAELRAAGAAIDRVHARVGEWLRAGRTEADVAADIAAAIVEEGHATAEFVIVGSGPNGASPHHSVSDRVIEDGDVVVVDIGGPLPSGYGSDSTRTYAVGVAPRARRGLGLRRAPGGPAGGRRRRAPGSDLRGHRPLPHATCSPRPVSPSTSSTAPATASGSTATRSPTSSRATTCRVEPGMTFSIEPGVYLAGRWGARIEDIVAVTDDGVERFNNRPTDLAIL